MFAGGFICLTDQGCAKGRKKNSNITVFFLAKKPPHLHSEAKADTNLHLFVDDVLKMAQPSTGLYVNNMIGIRKMMRKIIFLALLIAVSKPAVADWKKELVTNFKGEKYEIFSKKSSSGASLSYDTKDKFLIFSHPRHVLNGVNGIKIDGIYYDISEKTEAGDFYAISICEGARPEIVNLVVA